MWRLCKRRGPVITLPCFFSHYARLLAFTLQRQRKFYASFGICCWGSTVRNRQEWKWGRTSSAGDTKEEREAVERHSNRRMELGCGQVTNTTLALHKRTVSVLFWIRLTAFIKFSGLSFWTHNLSCRSVKHYAMNYVQTVGLVGRITVTAHPVTWFFFRKWQKKI